MMNLKTSSFAFRLLLASIISALGFCSELQEANAATKLGARCTKEGQISGSLLCAKFKSGKFFWVVAPKIKDEFSLLLPDEAYIENGPIPFKNSAKSNLKVEVASLTQDVCQITGSEITPIRNGKCQINFSTAGSKKFIAISKVETVAIKRKNEFTFEPEARYLLTSGTLILPRTSSAGLTMEYRSASKTICTARENVVEFISAGICLIASEQRGDNFTDLIPRTILTLNIFRENKISFVLPNELALRLKTYMLSANSSSGLPVRFRTSTPETCEVLGTTLKLDKLGNCTVIASQEGDSTTLRAEEISYSVKISGSRVLVDQPDSYSGFQMKPFYVVPADGIDRQYDINGYIADALTEGNSRLRTELGYEFQIDSIAFDYDIQYFKSSMSKTYMQSSSSLGTELMKELKIIDSLGENRKNYIFFIDVDGFNYDTACGYAGMPGMYAVVAVGPGKSTGSSCVGNSLQLTNYVSHTWVHETFHNLGVDHANDDPCDLMRGSSSSFCRTTWTIDKDRNRYVGSSNQGVNILSLRVWKGYTSDQALRASCILTYASLPRSDGLRYAICPTGTQFIGALKYCWNSVQNAELQVWRENTWQSLGQAKVYDEPWGKYVDWKCRNNYVAPWLEITVSNPGTQKYRWIVNGSEQEQFYVIWQR